MKPHSKEKNKALIPSTEGARQSAESTPAINSNDSGLRVLQVLLGLRKAPATLEELRDCSGHGTVGVAEIERCAKARGFAARIHTTDWEGLAALALPGIAALRNGGFLLLGKVNHEKAVVMVSGASRPTLMTRAEFEAEWDGRLILLEQAGAIAKLMWRFDPDSVAQARKNLTTVAQSAASSARTAGAGLVALFRMIQRAIITRSTNPKRLESHELAFLPAALEVVETPPSPVGRAISFSVIAVFGTALAWACIGTVDIVAVASGKIIPSSRTKTIQPFDTGVVQKIHVHDGQNVKAGDVLIELDTTSVDAELGHLRGDLMATRLEIARVQAAITNRENPLTVFTPPEGASPEMIQMHRGFLISQTSEQKAKLAAIDSQLAQKAAEQGTIQAAVDKLKSTITPLQQRVEIREQLFHKELGSKLTYLTELQDLVSQRQDILVQQSRSNETNAAIAALNETRAKTEAEYERSLFDELAKAEQKASGLKQDIIKAEQRRSLQRLKAPVDGMVQQLAIHTIGGVVTPAQTLMFIVPAESRLEIEAMIPNKDIGFVRTGQEVAIKVDTFNFTRYGLLHGTILNVSQDSIARDKPTNGASDKALGAETTSSEPRGQELLYAARISLDRTKLNIEGKQVNLSPGMAVTTEIKTGARQIISYLLSPLARYHHDSLRER
ncbi:HlyD family type I secretion periplasmic adaptor subunit [Afipia sp. TerB]